MPTATELVEPLALMFEDDGSIPNNPRLPLLIYRNAIDVSGTPDRESVIEAVFAEHGWGEMWRNGIHPYAHYHSSIHEVLGIARGRATVRFGGARGREIVLHWRLSARWPLRPLPRQQGRARRGADPYSAGAGPEGRSDLRRQRTAASPLARLIHSTLRSTPRSAL